VTDRIKGSLGHTHALSRDLASPNIPHRLRGQPSLQLVPGPPSPGVMRPRREADHSPPVSAEVKHEWRYTSTPSTRLHGVCMDSFTLMWCFSARSLWTRITQTG